MVASSALSPISVSRVTHGRSAASAADGSPAMSWMSASSCASTACRLTPSCSWMAWLRSSRSRATENSPDIA